MFAFFKATYHKTLSLATPFLSMSRVQKRAQNCQRAFSDWENSLQNMIQKPDLSVLSGKTEVSEII